MAVIDNIAPCKTKQVKANTQKWFVREVLENINTRDKLFKRFKKSILHIDNDPYKKAKYNTSKLTAKVRAFFDDKLPKPKEPWEILKPLNMSKRTLISNFNAVDSNNALKFDKKLWQNFSRISSLV